MSKKKNEEPFDPKNMKPEDKLKFEIATELGLDEKVIKSGRIGGLMTKRKREMKKEAMEETVS